jgi:hypothetical protein
MIQIDHFLGSVTGQGVRVEYNKGSHILLFLAVRSTYLIVDYWPFAVYDHTRRDRPSLSSRRDSLGYDAPFRASTLVTLIFSFPPRSN